MTQPNMQSLPTLLPKNRGAFTWKIWVAVQKITGRSRQRWAGSGMSVRVGVVMICVARHYSPKYTIHNRKALGRARFHVVNVGLGLDRFGLGLWDHLKLYFHLRPP